MPRRAALHYAAYDGDPVVEAGHMDRIIPWLASVCFHLGLGLVAAFVIYWTFHAFAGDKDRGPIVIPSSFEDPSFSEHAGGNRHPGELSDPLHDAAQDRLERMMESEGWKSSRSADADSQLTGMGMGADAAMIAPGWGAKIGAGKDGNVAAGGDVATFNNAGGGAGIAPRASYYGTGGNARKIVYIIDCSGSMVDHYTLPVRGVKAETERSISNLVPLQFFGVVTVSDTAKVVMDMARAVPENKEAFHKKFADSVAEGANDEALSMFQNAFEDALAMKPDLIYFLTDGGFSKALIPAVKKMNQEVGAKICTLEFDRYTGQTRSGDTEQTALLKELAGENGGVYRFVNDMDAGK